MLFVCTGNICRSPIAAALLSAAATDAMAVGSAGLLFDGRAASDGAIAWGDHMGLDLRTHRSRVVSPGLIAQADLILGMEPRHVREVVALVDTAWAKTFTLREFAARAGALPERGSSEPFDAWIGRIAQGRRRIDLMADDPNSSVADPYGCTFEVYDRTARQIEQCLAAISAAGLLKGLEIADEKSRRSA